MISPANAAIFNVSSAAQLTQALTDAAKNGEDDVVKIQQGTYVGNFVYASAEANGVIIEGGYTSGFTSRVVDPANTVLDGDELLNVLVLSAPNQQAAFLVEGVTLQNGSASDGGGLYVNSHGEITLTNNTISRNFCSASNGRGGGVYVSEYSTVTLTNNTITGNTAIFNGGGVYMSNCTVTLTSNTISENFSNYGGGVYGYVNTATLTNNTITGNTSNYGNGGGVYFSYSTVTLRNNTISENVASNGGGVYVCENVGGVSLTGNIITDNYCWNGNAEIGGGGGVYVYTEGWNTEITLTNNTITGNSVAAHSTTDARGGGVKLYMSNESIIAHIYNNIIWNNTAPLKGNDLDINNDGNGDFLPSTVELFNNVFDQSSDGIYIQVPFAIDPSNLNNIDPFFWDSANDDYHLAESSPCINTGGNDAPELPDLDKDGNDRILDGTVDIGAYEHKILYYRDADSDGYGNPSDVLNAETAPAGYVGNSTDCNDQNSSIHPGATEIRGDGIDQDCNGSDLESWGNPSSSLVLTNSSPVTVPSGSFFQIYGCAGVNNVTIEAGADAKLVNMPGNNIITIQSDSNLFTVSRSGATVTFEGTDGTMLKMPATKTAQIIVFNDKNLTLKIYEGSVMLGTQEIGTIKTSL